MSEGHKRTKYEQNQTLKKSEQKDNMALNQDIGGDKDNNYNGDLSINIAQFCALRSKDPETQVK